ncbi:hypothetical protein [Bacillus massiliglaciei]|uniref:hypothetical protein n=1 Tax=Bacillus massiliglaciei TaxID=1816693 RepID=UPI000DA63896|nr:hypothetical protein [Bacillus massiliglaciei]
MTGNERKDAKESLIKDAAQMDVVPEMELLQLKQQKEAETKGFQPKKKPNYSAFDNKNVE